MRALAVILSVMAMVNTACTKSSSDAGAGGTGYTYNSAGQCVNALGQLAPTAGSCSTQAYNSSLFNWNGSQCVNIAQQLVVDSRYCQGAVFSFVGSNCFDSIQQTVVSKTYCVPSNVPYYMDGNGVCNFSINQLPVSSNLACQRLANPQRIPCWGFYYSYYNGNWTGTSCAGTGSTCTGAILYVEPWGVPIACQ